MRVRGRRGEREREKEGGVDRQRKVRMKEKNRGVSERVRESE